MSLVFTQAKASPSSMALVTPTSAPNGTTGTAKPSPSNIATGGASAWTMFEPLIGVRGFRTGFDPFTS